MASLFRCGDQTDLVSSIFVSDRFNLMAIVMLTTSIFSILFWDYGKRIKLYFDLYKSNFWFLISKI